jgi:FkbM family methyltransferase
MSIHGKILILPLSHNAPIYLKQHPFYDSLPSRLSDFIHNRYGSLICIDVGANIGDTIAAFYKHSDDSFLAIEPNPKFNHYLHHNYGDKEKIRILNCICSSSSSKTCKFKVNENSGTASIASSESGSLMQTETLDNLIHVYPEYSNLNMIKIDTDGHDFKVIEGAREIIVQNLPVILFECDAFTNTSYVEDCLNTFSILKDAGYSSLVIYDNYGYLMGLYTMDNLHSIRNLLFYQLTSSFSYYDILLMKKEDMDCFLPSEQSYFINHMHNKKLMQTAAIAAGL